jgi:hypothetical protein
MAKEIIMVTTIIKLRIRLNFSSPSPRISRSIWPIALQENPIKVIYRLPSPKFYPNFEEWRDDGRW